jgi:hypothetical protein
MGIDRNEMADQLARQGSSQPLTGPKPALIISARAANRVIRDWTSSAHEEIGSPFTRQAKGFLKRPSANKELEND